MMQKILAFGFMLGMSVNVWATVTVVDSGSTTCGGSPNFSGQNCTILKSEIESALANGNVSVSSTSGNVVVSQSLTWDSGNTLTLNANENISINSSITATGASGKLTLEYGQGAIHNQNNLATYTIESSEQIIVKNREFAKITRKIRKLKMQPSFFDYAMEYQGGKKSTKFLSEMKELIPFEAIEKLLIEKSIYKPNKGKQGRPSTPANILVGALFLQSWYGLSDPMTEELIHDRISFRKFLDIKDEDTIPDEITICKFRNALIKKNLLESIFLEVKKSMIEENLILKRVMILVTM